MNHAENLLANPTEELRETAAHLKELSAASGSEARRDFPFEDGSSLAVTSREGADAQFEVTHPPEPDEE